MQTILVDLSSSSSGGSSSALGSGGESPGGSESSRSVHEVPPPILPITAPPALIELMAPPLLLTYGELAPLAKSPSPESPHPEGPHYSPAEVAGTSATWELRRSRGSLQLFLLPLENLVLSSMTARAINAMVDEAEIRLRLAPSLAEVDDMRAQLEMVNERFWRLERRKLEYEQRVRRHVEEDRRAELNFVAADGLINFLKHELCRVTASKDEGSARRDGC